MGTKFKAGEYVLNGVTHKLTAPQMQAMAVLNMPSLNVRFRGIAVTGDHTSLPEYYEGKNAHHYTQTPKIHHRTAQALANRGLATVHHDIYLQEFVVRPVSQTMKSEPDNTPLEWTCVHEYENELSYLLVHRAEGEKYIYRIIRWVYTDEILKDRTQEDWLLQVVRKKDIEVVEGAGGGARWEDLSAAKTYAFDINRWWN